MAQPARSGLYEIGLALERNESRREEREAEILEGLEEAFAIHARDNARTKKRLGIAGLASLIAGVVVFFAVNLLGGMVIILGTLVALAILWGVLGIRCDDRALDQVEKIGFDYGSTAEEMTKLLCATGDRWHPDRLREFVSIYGGSAEVRVLDLAAAESHHGGRLAMQDHIALCEQYIVTAVFLCEECESVLSNVAAGATCRCPECQSWIRIPKAPPCPECGNLWVVLESEDKGELREKLAGRLGERAGEIAGEALLGPVGGAVLGAIGGAVGQGTHMRSTESHFVCAGSDGCGNAWAYAVPADEGEVSREVERVPKARLLGTSPPQPAPKGRLIAPADDYGHDSADPPLS